MKIKLKHKPFMESEYYIHRCFDCKHRVVTDTFCSINSDVCTYPNANKCMKKSIAYKFGRVLGMFVVFMIPILTGLTVFMIIKIIF